MRKTRTGLFLAVSIAAGLALFHPSAAEAKRLGVNALETAHQPQSRALKIPKVRRAARPMRKSQPVALKYVPVHSPSCTELPSTPEFAGFGQPWIDDDDDDVVLPDFSANNDDSRRFLLREVRSVLFEYKSERENDPKPRILARVERPIAIMIRVRTLPELPDSSDDAALA